jgi:hypothetical protein
MEWGNGVEPSQEEVDTMHGEIADDGFGPSAGGSWDEGGRAIAQDSIASEEETQGITDYFPGAAATFRIGYTFLSYFNSDENSVYRKTNLYYPFSCSKDLEIALWLLRSGLSMGKIDAFLSLEMVGYNQVLLNLY